MNTYTYEIVENGYIIKKNGDNYLIQLEPFIPNKSLSYKENAELHIQEQIENDNKTNIVTKRLEEKVNDIDLENKQQNQAIAEITMMIATPNV